MDVPISTPPFVSAGVTIGSLHTFPHTPCGQSPIPDPLLDENGVIQDATVVGVGLVRVGPRVRGGQQYRGWKRGRAQHVHYHDDVNVSQVTQAAP